MTNNPNGSWKTHPEHKLKEHVNHNGEYTGLFYCVKCNKAEVELFEPCEKQEGEQDG